VGRTDIEDALVRLDKLTRDELGMVAAEVLKTAHGVDDRVNTVLDSAHPISNALCTAS
jgi:hypothetical protein